MTKRKTIAQLTAEIANLTDLLSVSRDAVRGWQGEVSKLKDEVKESRSQFADLKERLLNSETETARLRGYMSRVHEDDIVRDGFVEIGDEGGKRQVPKRPPPMQRSHQYEGNALEMSDTFDNYGNRKPRTHWTSY